MDKQTQKILEKENQLKKIDNMIIKNIRNIISIKLGFLNIAFNNLEIKKYQGTFAVNGKEIYYNPNFLIREYKNAPRIFLHMILHCIFLHMFVKDIKNIRCWNLACDIAVENIINNLDIKELKNSNQNNQDCENIKKNIKYMTAEHIYRYLLNAPSEEIIKLEYMFTVDDHSIWYPKEKIKVTGDKKNQYGENLETNKGGNAGGGSSSSGDQDSNNVDENSISTNTKTFDDNSDNSDNSETQENQSKNQESKHQSNPQENNIPNMEDYDSAETSRNSNDDIENNNSQNKLNENLKKQKLYQWKNIAETIESDIETFSLNKGDKAGNLRDNLKMLNREKVDYKEFLRKFATLKETMEINDDEFDYVFYNYGMSLTGNMPLIEPLEYKEISKICDFVIAIDTSGSVAGELVNKFLNKTYNILCSQEAFGKKINIYIIQCDCEIQSVTLVNNLDEIKEYMENLIIKGYGGTDFRPVFEFVDNLVAERKLKNLKGLLYFTDGVGTFPKTMPKYKTAIAYIRDYCEFKYIPSWAINLELDLDQIEDLEKIEKIEY